MGALIIRPYNRVRPERASSAKKGISYPFDNPPRLAPRILWGPRQRSATVAGDTNKLCGWVGCKKATWHRFWAFFPSSPLTERFCQAWKGLRSLRIAAKFREHIMCKCVGGCVPKTICGATATNRVTRVVLFSCIPSARVVLKWINYSWGTLFVYRYIYIPIYKGCRFVVDLGLNLFDPYIYVPDDSNNLVLDMFRCLSGKHSHLKCINCGVSNTRFIGIDSCGVFAVIVACRTRAIYLK